MDSKSPPYGFKKSALQANKQSSYIRQKVNMHLFKLCPSVFVIAFSISSKTKKMMGSRGDIVGACVRPKAQYFTIPQEYHKVGFCQSKRLSILSLTSYHSFGQNTQNDSLSLAQFKNKSENQPISGALSCNSSIFVKCTQGMKGLSDNFEESHSKNIRNLDQTGEIHNKLMPNSRVLQKSRAKQWLSRNREVKKSNSLSKKMLTFFCYGKSQLCDIPGEL